MITARGELFDGASTGAQLVELTILEQELCITTFEKTLTKLPFADITSAEKTADGFRITLRHKSDTVAPMICFTNTSFFFVLQKKLSDLHHPFKQVIQSLWHLHWWQLLIISIIGIAVFIHLFFLVLLKAYTLTPSSYDAHLGNKFDSSMTTVYTSCSTPELDSFLAKAMTRLSRPDDHFPHRVIVLNYTAENALSIPGGTIYLFRGLLESSSSPDEILGVLSHEIVHAEKRHSVQQMINSMGVYYMSSLVIGMAIDGMDMLESLESALEASSLLFTLHYSRSFEREADSLGIERLHSAGLRVGPLDTLLTRISPKPRGRTYLMSLFSTHPLQKERSERFSRARAEETFAPDTQFTCEREEWDIIKLGCSDEKKKVPLWKKVLRKK